MYLKKKFIQIPFLNRKIYSIIYSDENDLKNGVIKLCNYLKKGPFLIRVFSGDNLNSILSLYSNSSLNYKNFTYYKIDDLNFLDNISFEGLRFLNIYAVNQNCLIDMSKLKNVQENYTFQLGFDNYLEYVEIVINYNYYDKRKIDNIFEIL